VQANPKSFDLSKFRAKLLKIWAKFLKMRAKMAPNVVDFNKWRTTFAKKHTKTFCGGHTKKMSS